MGRTAVLIIFLQAALSAQTPDETRDILKFGLENQVVDVVKNLALRKDAAWEADILNLLTPDSARVIQEAAIRYFVSIRSDKAKEAMAFIIPELPDWQPNMMLTVIEYLGELKITDHHPALAEHLESDSLSLKAAVIRLLGKLTLTEYAPRFLAMLRDPLTPQELTGDLVTSLGLLAHAPASEEIIGILEDSGSGFALKSLCLEALARIGGPEAEAAVRARLQDDNAIVRATALRNAVKFPALAGETNLFLRALRDSTANVRLAAAEALEEKPMPEARELLIYRIAHDPEVKVRSASLKAIQSLDRGEWEKQILETVEKRRSDSIFWNEAVKLSLENQIGGVLPLLRTALQTEGRLSNSPVVTSLAGHLSVTNWAEADSLFGDVMETNNQNAQLTILRTIQRRDLRGMQGQLETWGTRSRYPQVQAFIRNLLKNWNEPISE